MTNILPTSSQNISAPFIQLPEHMAVIIAPQAGRSLLLELAARLAIRGPLRVLDGGNQFNAYPVARAVRRYTPDLANVLQDILLARAFTCYQMASLIADSPAGATPTLVFDLLATFYDENVSLYESRRLLATCLSKLQCLGQTGPVIVGAQPPGAACQERQVLLDLLRKSTTQVWEAK
jgi:hypothetical protein